MTTDAAPGAGAPQTGAPTPEQQATSNLMTGLYLSAIRCVLTYVVVPMAGALAGLASLVEPAAVVLQVVAAVFAVRGARRLWATGHGLKWLYAAIAVVLVVWAAVTVVLAIVHR